MKPTRTWVLIADGARARILENDGPGRGLKPVEGCAFSGEHGATHEIMTDRTGRAFASVGAQRSAIEARSDPHRELKKRFANQLAEVLAGKLQQKAYDRLVIVAAPSTLGDLRTALSDQVRATVTAEVPKDLTKTPDPEVAGHLEDVLRV
ncbi:MAG TPA: host attachment protein [Hyphomicrobiaceae bacterium]|nr:host attachment protein [Hyphomicrobiaceae bacterium]